MDARVKHSSAGGWNRLIYFSTLIQPGAINSAEENTERCSLITNKHTILWKLGEYGHQFHCSSVIYVPVDGVFEYRTAENLAKKSCLTHIHYW